MIIVIIIITDIITNVVTLQGHADSFTQ